MNKNLVILVSIVVALVVSGGAFYGGMVFGKSQGRIGRPDFTAGAFQGIQNRQAGQGFVLGTVLSKDDTSIVVQLPNNAGSKIIFYSGSTEVSKFAKGAISDIEVGSNISVNGKTNTDGSVSAQTIQIRPTQNQNLPVTK